MVKELSEFMMVSIAFYTFKVGYINWDSWDETALRWRVEKLTMAVGYGDSGFKELRTYFQINN